MTVDATEVTNNINRFVSTLLPQALQEGLEQACLFVEAESKKNCPPSVTGNLRASITHTVEENGDKHIGYIGSNLDYAPYVHQGTGIYAIEGNGRKNVPWNYYDERKGEWQSTEGIQPTPFIQMAIDSNRERLITHFSGCLNGSSENS